MDEIKVGNVGSSDEDDYDDNFDNLHVAQNRKGKKAGGWQSLGLDHFVFTGIQKAGYLKPTPIQRKAIPLILDGKDVVAMSRTGTGKTAAFVVPMLQKLKARKSTGIRALIVSPTRELATQTYSVVKKLGKCTGLRASCLVGGDSMDEQFSAIHDNPDILIATPGRLLHIVVEMNLRLTTVQYVVFDEADRLFEMGFAPQLHDVLKRLPEDRQTLLISATMPKTLISFAKAGLSDPEMVRLDAEKKISSRLAMAFIACRASDKLSALLYLARRCVQKKEQTIVFCATQKFVEYVVTIFKEAGLPACYIHGGMDSTARKQNIASFRNKECYLLVSSEVAARGVDIPLLDNAINFHFSHTAKMFIHRVGRVARAGNSGTAYSLVSQDEMPYVIDLFLLLGRPLQIAKFNEQYKSDDFVIGGFPDDLVHLESDFLKNIHELSMEVSDLKHKADNQLKNCVAARPAASAESVRRSKREFKNIIYAPHPILEASAFTDSVDHNVLEAIRNYKPAIKVFESKHAIKEVKKQISIVKEIKKQKLDAQKEKDRAEHYVSYKAHDADVEKAFQMDQNFNQMANDASIDIIADDDKSLRKMQSAKKWDRSKKKYVGDTNTVKRIRTEEGTLVPASFKSGRYEKWQRTNKVKYRRDDDNDGENKSAVSYNLGHMKKKAVYKNGDRSNKPGKSELKSAEQIFRDRRKKESKVDYMIHRRKENLKKKVGSLKNHSSDSGKFKSHKSGGARSFKGKPQSGGKSFKSKSQSGGRRGKK